MKLVGGSLEKVDLVEEKLFLFLLEFSQLRCQVYLRSFELSSDCSGVV